MSRHFLIKSVIHHLERNGFKFLKYLGSGGYADVIAVLTPSKEEMAVKIIEKQNIWDIEDKFWPILKHPDLLQVTQVKSVDELEVKLYFMPVLPKVLDFTVHSEEFRSDPHGLIKIKKWFRQILSGIDYLHSSGMCHLDIKSDNVLIDRNDNAKLSDFSGLNFTKHPLDTLCSPVAFRPPECFASNGAKNIRGELFDIWTFGLMSLNVLTGHYFQIKTNALKVDDSNWMTQIWPILEETMKEGNFRHLIRRALPNASLSECDVHEALHFIKFIMKMQPEERPNAARVKKHPFLKTNTNPFYGEQNESLRKNTNGANPFEKMKYRVDPNTEGENEASRRPIEFIKHKQTAESFEFSEDVKYWLPDHYQIGGGEIDICNPSHWASKTDSNKSYVKGKSMKKSVKNWFKKQFNKMFKKK